MQGDWGSFTLAIAAMMGLLVVVVLFCFDLADQGTSESTREAQLEEDRKRRQKKAA